MLPVRVSIPVGFVPSVSGEASLSVHRRAVDLVAANPGKASLLLAVVLFAASVAGYLEFPSAPDPGRARALFGLWVLGLVAGVAVVVVDSVYIPRRVDFPNALLILAALVVASLVAVDAELRTR